MLGVRRRVLDRALCTLNWPFNTPQIVFCDLFVLYLLQLEIWHLGPALIGLNSQLAKRILTMYNFCISEKLNSHLNIYSSHRQKIMDLKFPNYI